MFRRKLVHWLGTGGVAVISSKEQQTVWNEISLGSITGRVSPDTGTSRVGCNGLWVLWVFNPGGDG